MAKDRSAPFSRKHRRYWIPVTGGMVLIGAINLAIGYWSWPDTSLDRTPERIIPQLPVSEFARPDAQPGSDAGAWRDAGPEGPDSPGDAAAGPASEAEARGTLP